MAKKKKKKSSRKKKSKESVLKFTTKQKIKALGMFVVALIFIASLFELAGPAGEAIRNGFNYLIGKAVFIIPLFFIITGLIFLKPKYKGKLLPLLLGVFVLIIGMSGILGAFDITKNEVTSWIYTGKGGILGNVLALPLINYFGILVANVILGAVIIGGLVIFFQFIEKEIIEKEKTSQVTKKLKKAVSSANRIKEAVKKKEKSKETQPRISRFKEKIKLKGKETTAKKGKYVVPPLKLLTEEKGRPTSGDIKKNSKIIKKTLDNFGISVEMAEANIGPTVTQYTFKPAEGIKLSKITTLSRNLSLALAAHPIRIEAPIPGRSLVGVEVPNKKRAQVRLRNLIGNSAFQDSSIPLLFCLGRGVSGSPMYANLGKMPHLLVAGATGSGKTVFLNGLVLSLLYRNSPRDLNFILVDPKRVEFQSYNHFSHLLTPVITNVDTAINALQWLVKEMERRFEVFSTVPTRNISTYNSLKSVKSSGKQIPYIVVIIDELADFMASKGKEMEGAIVRLAQMARATGIHLVVATQRPSVEVITGLIKANITSRVTFQVASQVDSRTVLDMAGAENLLGDGDMLYISSQMGKPKRVQGVYVSEKEVKKVTKFIKNEKKAPSPPSKLSESIEGYLEKQKQKPQTFEVGEDELYEDAKKLVIEADKGSASLLQRRLRIGYARAARLLDMLQEKGIVGPPRGSKPRKVIAEEEDDSEIDF